MKYQYWLSNIPGVGCKTIHRLLGQAGSAEEIYFLKKEQLEKLSGLSDRQVHAITDRKKNWNLEEKYAALGESGISFLSCEMESYPKQLRNIVDAPYSLYIKGKMPVFLQFVLPLPFRIPSTFSPRRPPLFFLRNQAFSL